MSVSVHTHVAGRNVKLSHIRAGKEVTRIIDDNHYSHNYQEIRQLENETKVLPGDFMVLECSYNTENLDKPTLGGYSLHEEMCLSIITYYPKTELGRSTIPFQTTTKFLHYLYFLKKISWLLLNGSC